MSSRSIFSGTGGISRHSLVTHEKNKPSAFITITTTSGDFLHGVAPVTGVLINQLTDFSVTKSLDKDFLVATFGDTPVRITLKGINFFNLNGCDLGQSRLSKKQILNFYKDNRVSTNINNRVDISIATGKNEPAVSFRCIITGLDVQNNASNDGTSNVYYEYGMSLIGVDRS